MTYDNFLNYLGSIHKSKHNIPVDLERITKDLKIEVFGTKDFENNISGKIYYNEEHKEYRIVVNTNHPNTRQRFTIAHEIAHYILHKDRIRENNGIVDTGLYKSNLYNYLELEADRLAADILMPYDILMPLAEESNYDTESIETLAKKFDVSYTSMSLRLGFKA